MSDDRSSAHDVVALLDDLADATAVLEWSSVLARVVRRDLTVVYVESLPVLRAAALPITRALAHAGGQWAAFDERDIELGWRVHAARLRTLAERVSHGQRVHCSIRITRDALDRAALGTASDLVLIGAPSAARAGGATTPARLRRLLALVDESPSGRQVAQLADALAGQLGAAQVRRRIDATHAAELLAAASADLLVMSRALADPALLGRVRRPVLLVGTEATR